MDNTITLAHRDSLIMLKLRQLFYTNQLYLVIIALILNIVLNIILVVILTYFINRPVQPIYFTVNDTGQLITEIPLNQPNMSTEKIANWVIDAIESSYSYDFINYRQQIQSSQQYFSDYGWQKYIQSLKDSNNLLALTTRKMIVTAKVVATPKLVVQGLLGGIYAWKFSIPVLLNYSYPPYNKTSQFDNPLNITVIISRRSTTESDSGLGIMQMIANIATTDTINPNLANQIK
jgi:intracellular multiplication protein IcmL